jgi:hypothetical protein
MPSQFNYVCGLPLSASEQRNLDAIERALLEMKPAQLSGYRRRRLAKALKIIWAVLAVMCIALGCGWYAFHAPWSHDALHWANARLRAEIYEFFSIHP